MMLVRCAMVIAGLLTLAATAGAYEEPVMLNKYAQVAIDGLHGGAVTWLEYRPAMSFPFIADRGARMAGRGRLFATILRVGDKEIDLAGVAMQETHIDHLDQHTLRFTATLAKPALAYERIVRGGDSESGVRITDTLRNDGDVEIALRVGARSQLRAETWRLASRSWFGDADEEFLQVSPAHAGERTAFAAKSPRVFWRVIGQYGVGFLYQATAPLAPVDVVHVLPARAGHPAEMQWLSAEIRLAPGKSISWQSVVLVDEGGRQGNDAATLATGGRVIVTADLRAGGEPDEDVLGFGTVVSPMPHKVKMIVRQCMIENDKPVAGSEKTIAEQALSLTPGKGAFIHFSARAAAKGILGVEVTVLDDRGAALGVARNQSIIDGRGLKGEAGRIWREYQTRMHENLYRGTWAEIGAQLAKQGHLKPLDPADPATPKRMVFFEKNFPYYAEMLKGAAATKKVAAAAPVAPAAADPPAPPACMDIFFNGPDGPINAFSKERSGTGLSGLDYTKVLPDRGYAFHTYMGYGVNAAGLSTSGATINCDGRTDALGQDMARKWKAAGKEVAPQAMWMILAMCKDVDEALAFIDNPDAPFEFTGNMLLVDRAGNAARVESAGILHQVHRYNPKEPGFLVAGNYAHRNAEGRFDVGGNWGWAANTMLREHFLAATVGDRRDNISLADVFWLMATHCPGGLCQHIFDNPATLYSSCSFIAVTRTSELWLSHGPPCKTQYVRYRLFDDEKK